jgi:hypothetical protein
MVGIKGNGLVSEAGGAASSGAQKGVKATITEAGKFIETVKGQIGTGSSPPKKLIQIEPNGQKAEAERQVKIKQIQANIRRLAAREREEREKVAQAQEYYREIREAKLVAEEEEKRKFSPLGALDWFVKMGKKARGWILERKQGERKPAGFRG